MSVDYLEFIFGLSEKDLTLWHMIARMSLVYVLGIIILNVFNKRFINENSPFDVILRFVIGNSLADGILGSSPFFPTLGVVFFIICLHWCLSLFSFYNRPFEKFLKGRTYLLYKDGVFVWKAMQHNHLTMDDLYGEIRRSGLVTFDDVKEIMLESSGEVSVIPLNHNNHHKKMSDKSD